MAGHRQCRLWAAADGSGPQKVSGEISGITPRSQLPTDQNLRLLLGAGITRLWLKATRPRQEHEKSGLSSVPVGRCFARPSPSQRLQRHNRTCRPTKVARELSKSIAHRRMGLEALLLRGSSAADHDHRPDAVTHADQIRARASAATSTSEDADGGARTRPMLGRYKYTDHPPCASQN